MAELYDLSGQRVLNIRDPHARSKEGAILARLNGSAIEKSDGEVIGFVDENCVKDLNGNIVVKVVGDEVYDAAGETIARVDGGDMLSKAFSAAVYYYFGSGQDT